MQVLTAIATIWICASILAAIIVLVDVIAHPHHMAIMNVVWPVTALWSGPLGAWAYFRYGRTRAPQPHAIEIAKGTTHCGAGCMLGDIVAELFALGVPFAIAGHKIFGSWIYDYVAAFALGILFQYFTIKPMKHLSRRDGVIAAIKADALSLSAWQVGMYGWMAIATFALFHHELPKSSPVFWFMMQIAMAIGFLTSYPVNAWLMHKGIKEAM